MDSALLHETLCNLRELCAPICQVSWRKLMDLPLENQEAKKDKGEDEDSDDEDPEELPPRLLSAGPKGNQVMIFKTQGSEGHWAYCI